MAIKVGKKKAQIGAGVIEYYQVVAEDALRGIFNKIHNSPNMIGAELLKRKRGDIARLNAILTRTGPGKGIDLELTRLRGIDLDTIGIEKVHGVTWFVGHTKGLIIKTMEGKGRSARYGHSDKVTLGSEHNCGDYKIYFPAGDLATPRVELIHFVPDLDPMTTSRHFHHRAMSRPNNPMHPTELKASTCWGGFAEPVAACMEACDLPDLFRMLRGFVGRRNPQSLLLRSLPHEVFKDD